MKRYDGILLCSDLDHTLTGDPFLQPERGLIDIIPRANVDAVKRFVSNGGVFAVVSGRNPDEIAELANYMPLYDLCVASNGTAVYSIGAARAVFGLTMGREAEEAVRFFAARADRFGFLRMTDSDFNFTFLRAGDDPDEVLRCPRFPLYKFIVSFFDPVTAAELYGEAKKRFGDRFAVTTSGACTLEICPCGSGKGVMLKKLIELSGRKFDRVVCVGDGENDIGMIEFADVGYAVGNAVDSLKAAADRVTVSSDKAAVAAVIAEL